MEKPAIVRAFLLFDREFDVLFVVGIKDELKLAQPTGETERAWGIDPSGAEIGETNFPPRLIGNAWVDIDRERASLKDQIDP